MSTRVRTSIMAVLFICAASCVQAQVLFQENFDDGVADGFTVHYGTWDVVDGKYHVRTTGYATESASMVSVPGSADWIDYHFECDLLVQGGVGHLVKFRASSPGNCYEVDMRGAPYNDVFLQKRVNGNFQFLAVVPFDNATGEWHHLAVDVMGPQITVIIDGVLVCTYIDLNDPYLQGTVGLMGWSGGDVGWQELYCDNVLVGVDVVPVEGTTWGNLKSLFR